MDTLSNLEHTDAGARESEIAPNTLYGAIICVAADLYSVTNESFLKGESYGKGLYYFDQIVYDF